MSLPAYCAPGSGARPRPGGFTLVEVVVALTILSLIMLTTITGLRTLGSTQAAIDRTTDRVDELRTVSSFLRDTMESAAVGGRPGRSSGSLAFGGTSANADTAFFDLGDNALAWKSTILFGESFGGSYLVRVAQEDDQLVLRWQQGDRRGKPGDWTKAEAHTLVARLEEFQVSWRKDHGDQWLQQFEQGDEAGWVRLQVRAAGRFWPELVMQVPR